MADGKLLNWKKGRTVGAGKCYFRGLINQKKKVWCGMLNYFHHFHILCNSFAKLCKRLFWKHCFRYSLVIFSTQINTQIWHTLFPVDLYFTILDLTEISVKNLCAMCISVLLQLFYFTPNDSIDLPNSNSVARYWVHRSTKWAATVIELLMLRCACVCV